MPYFETIGSATVIAYDDEPILTTDPWLNTPAYFGSWGQDYEIPPQQLAAIQNAKYHWFSHGHPDHLNAASLPSLGKGQFLLSDHYGGRIHRELVAAGFSVKILPDRTWVPLSKNVRVYSVSNRNQDSLLLIDVNGRLVVNLNDSDDYGESFRIRPVARSFKEVYLLQLHGWGGADMLNLFDPAGRKLVSPKEKRRSIAPRAQRAARLFGANKVIPFSSFHRYQRSDSAWGNDLVPDLADYETGARRDGAEILPAFVRVNCETDEIEKINPPRCNTAITRPEDWGDNWSDPLDIEDKKKITSYFLARQTLQDHFGFIKVTAGGSSVTVDLNRDMRNVGIEFECPRQSFMTCIEHEIFDDLLIGNFMRTTLHNVSDLYPHFSPYVAKYADNGGAKSKREVMMYFGHYYMRDPIAHSLKILTTSSEMAVRKILPEESWLFRTAKRLYYDLAPR